MRVTDQMMVNTVLDNLATNDATLQSVMNQLTSGKQLSQMSDNPADGARALAVQVGLDQTGQYLHNGDAASGWLSATDSALQGVNQLLLRAQQLAVQGANDTNNTGDRQAMAAEVSSLLGTAVQLGNSTFAGSYVFAGSQTTSAPFAFNNGAVVFANNTSTATTALQRQIAAGTQIQVNVVGHDPTSNNAVFDTVFSTLSSLENALQTNNTSAIQSSITQVGSALQQVLQSQATVGATTDQVQTTQNQLTMLQDQMNQSLATIVDTDMAKASTDYAQATIVQKAGLAAAAKALPPSLFDYLA